MGKSIWETHVVIQGDEWEMFTELMCRMGYGFTFNKIDPHQTQRPERYPYIKFQRDRDYFECNDHDSIRHYVDHDVISWREFISSERRYIEQLNNNIKCIKGESIYIRVREENWKKVLNILNQMQFEWISGMPISRAVPYRSHLYLKVSTAGGMKKISRCDRAENIDHVMNINTFIKEGHYKRFCENILFEWDDEAGDIKGAGALYPICHKETDPGPGLVENSALVNYMNSANIYKTIPSEGPPGDGTTISAEGKVLCGVDPYLYPVRPEECYKKPEKPKVVKLPDTELKLVTVKKEKRKARIVKFF